MPATARRTVARRRRWRLHPAGSGLRPVRLAARGAARAFQPAWSPNGKQIAFGLSIQSGPQNGLEGIYTADIDGSDMTPARR
jgi:Tol biopolymer transport system component